MDGGVHSHGACRSTCDSPSIAKQACYEINRRASRPRSLTLTPPLTIEEAELDPALGILDGCIGEVG